MKRVYIQIVDPVHDVYQSACIQEPVESMVAINHACRHFGFDQGEVDWSIPFISKEGFPNMPSHVCMAGSVKGTSKLVTIIELDL